LIKPGTRENASVEVSRQKRRVGNERARRTNEVGVGLHVGSSFKVLSLKGGRGKGNQNEREGQRRRVEEDERTERDGVPTSIRASILFLIILGVGWNRPASCLVTSFINSMCDIVFADLRIRTMQAWCNDRKYNESISQ